MRTVYLAALVLIPCLRPLAADSEHFEKRIRPLLSQKCYACHGGKTAMSGLRLDTKAGWQKGGSRGTAIIPGDPEHSLIVRAVSHADATLRMPPAARLSDAEIADLTEWIRGGAFDPRTEAVPVTSIARTHWSFQPVKAHSAPTTRNRVWPRSFIDSFLLRELEAKGLRPAVSADKRTLLRRITFDLTGLPPEAREIADFLADASPKAFEQVVDRLLSSPHYGERWGRHWLDLVRFAETAGHEFDSDKPDAWRYRDYVIRAFNDDVPYTQFIREQIAGDLMVNPRYSADGSRLESPLGSAFFGLHEERNAADDLAEVRCEKTDNQIDVLGKTFLGLTVACARCHDHKFDPIPAADYYSLSGILYSTRQAEFQLDSAAVKQKMHSLREQVGAINAQLAAEMPRSALDVSSRLLHPDAALLAVMEGAAKDPTHILYPLAKLRAESVSPFAERIAALRAELKDGASEMTKRGDLIFADFRTGDYSGWDVQGPAFGREPSVVVPPNLALSGYRGGGLASSFGTGSNVFTGVLNSKSFVATKRFMHVRLTSTPDRTRRREHGALRFTLQIAGRPAYLNATKDGVFEWQTAGLERQMDLPAYFVIADRAPDGYIAVEKIILSDQRQPPKFDIAPNPRLVAMLEQPIDSLASLAAAYQKLFEDALADPQPGIETQWILTALPPVKPESIAGFEQQRREIEKQFPAASYGMLSREDTPVNAHILARGNPMNRGEEVPHRFLRVLSRDGSTFTSGSGRLELAEAIASPANPLTARVMVNRVWKHHFGAGLVRSLDNFGAMGERPSHPELLDTLAAKFIESGWSVKALHRMIVLSAAYRMSSEAGALARQRDPENRLLHSMAVRRLEAESIRDSVLAVSGALDRTVYGKSVKPFISPYQDGRGKPASGPLDANGRRSVYIEVRRNFLPPLLMAFDFPVPFTTIGNRGTTTVPSQALMMMNNEFVNQQAEKWAARVLREFTDPKERIHGMFVEAYGRPPEPAEIASIDGFLREQAAAHNVTASDVKPWADLAHVVFNSKEFIFLR